jgi:sterol desaturase/sphingolipid hydroxylase (fatty acid hydroxylase superfamily)
MTFSEWILANGDDLQFVLFFAALLVLAVAERFVPRRLGPMDRWVRWPTNYLLTFVNVVAVSVLPISFIGAAAWAEAKGWGLLNQVSLPLLALVVAALLVRGFISFFTHYLMHMVPMLWRVHRVHHLDTELDVSSTVRFHPLEFIVALLPGVSMVVAFGLTPWVLMFYELLDVMVNLWSHSNLRLPRTVDSVFRYLVVTPDLHRIHHSAWKPETNSNFGAVFPIWDLVFGTFQATPRDGHERMRLGLDEVRGREAHRPLWLLGSVFSKQLTATSSSSAEHSSSTPNAAARVHQ